jgi:hypothetical protein
MPQKKDTKKAPKKKDKDKKTANNKNTLTQSQNVKVNVIIGNKAKSKGGNKPPPVQPKDKAKELATILGMAIKANIQRERLVEYNKPPPSFTTIPSTSLPPRQSQQIPVPSMPVASSQGVGSLDDPMPIPARPIPVRPIPVRPTPFQPIPAPRALLPPPRVIIEEPDDDNDGEWAGGSQLMLEDGEVEDEYEDWDPPARRESPILETTTIYQPPVMDKGFSHKNLTERMPMKPVEMEPMRKLDPEKPPSFEPPRILSLEKPPSSLIERISKRRVGAEERPEEEEEPTPWLGNTPADRSPPPMPSWYRTRVPPPPPVESKPEDDDEVDIFKPRRGRPPKEDQTLSEYELAGKYSNLSRMTPQTFASQPERNLKLDDFKLDVLKRLYDIHKVSEITSKKPTKNDYIIGMGKNPYIRPSQKKA